MSRQQHRLNYLVKWGHWQLLQSEGASLELRSLVLDEVALPFSPWVQRFCAHVFSIAFYCVTVTRGVVMGRPNLCHSCHLGCSDAGWRGQHVTRSVGRPEIFSNGARLPSRHFAAEARARALAGKVSLATWLPTGHPLRLACLTCASLLASTTCGHVAQRRGSSHVLANDGLHARRRRFAFHEDFGSQGQVEWCRLHAMRSFSIVSPTCMAFTGSPCVDGGDGEDDMRPVCHMGGQLPCAGTLESLRISCVTQQ